MNYQTLSDARMADYAARMERVNRVEWMRKTAVPIRRHPRRPVGDALVRFGAWLQGVPAGRAADPVTV
jgi:hypothetical protein